MVGVKAILLDGAYHDVDSSEMAFKIAGSQVLKEGVRRANPILLEPLMAVEVRTPEEYMGDVIGDLNSRRGMIQSMEDASGVKVVRANVPLSEMFGYIGDLRSKTQGRAVYSMQFDSYSEVPKAVADEIIQKTRGNHLAVHAAEPRPKDCTQADGARRYCAQPADSVISPNIQARSRLVQVSAARSVAGEHVFSKRPRRNPWRRQSSSGLSRTSTSVPSVTLTTVRPR
jgi:hypothetical protein